MSLHYWTKFWEKADTIAATNKKGKSQAQRTQQAARQCLLNIYAHTPPHRNYSCLWAQNWQLNILNSRAKQVKFRCFRILCPLLLYFAPFAAYILFRGVNIYQETNKLAVQRPFSYAAGAKWKLSFLKYLSDWQNIYVIKFEVFHCFENISCAIATKGFNIFFELWHSLCLIKRVLHRFNSLWKLQCSAKYICTWIFLFHSVFG